MEILRIICCISLLAVALPAGNGLSREPGRDAQSRVVASQDGSVDLAANKNDASNAIVKRSGLEVTTGRRGRNTVKLDERIALRGDVSPGDDKGSRKSSSDQAKTSEADRVWRSQELNILAVGMGVGDVDGDGTNEIVLIDPDTVYLYRLSSGKMERLAEYSARPLELKSVDVAKLRKQGPARIYVTAQNRGAVSSFVLEYRDRKLTPVVQDYPYYLRLIHYPTQGPILLGQKKGISKLYDGPVYRLTDKGDDLEVLGRFGVPLKIPVFGFAIGDFEGKHIPLIAVYDKDDHLRLYDPPTGKRLFLSKDYYGGSDVLLRKSGPEATASRDREDMEPESAYFRPRILAHTQGAAHEILVIAHSSKTMRLLGRTRMFEEGQVVALVWNGDSLEEKWTTPKVQGMITDFAIDTLPGFAGRRLITLERKKTDWLAFLRSESQVRVYNLDSLMSEGQGGKSRADR